MPEDASGYREQDGCWNCAAIKDFAHYDDHGEWRCTDERRCRSEHREWWPEEAHPRVAPGGICSYHQKEE